MIDAISGVADTSADLFSSQIPGGQLGKDEFLNLLIAQLKNQDPLSPMEADQLAVQLAQFSSVEQLTEINKHIQSLGAGDEILAGSVATSTAVSLIGKNVRAVVDRLTLDGSGSATLDVAPKTAGQATVHLFDAQGTEVASYDAGTLVPGEQTLDLSKLDQQMPPGTYGVSIEISDASGNTVPIPATISGYVNGVRYERAGPVLMVGVTEFPLSSVIEVSN